MAGFYVLNGTFIGSGHTKISLIISVGRLWLLRLPLIIVFKNFTDWGCSSVWYAMVLSNLITVVIAFIIFKTGQWKEPVVKLSKHAA